MKFVKLQSRIKLANDVLKTFIHPSNSINFFSVNNKLFLEVLSKTTNKVRISEVRIRKSHDFFQKRNIWPGGSTSEQAAVQLVNYIRDYPRLPIITWKYWSCPTIKLCNEDTIRLLQESDYEGPKTQCVLCGSKDFKNGLDWWSLNKKVGPCCWGGSCIDKH